jgi:hypothetical protein
MTHDCRGKGRSNLLPRTTFHSAFVAAKRIVRPASGGAAPANNCFRRIIPAIFFSALWRARPRERDENIFSTRCATASSQNFFSSGQRQCPCIPQIVNNRRRESTTFSRR